MSKIKEWINSLSALKILLGIIVATVTATFSLTLAGTAVLKVPRQVVQRQTDLTETVGALDTNLQAVREVVDGLPAAIQAAVDSHETKPWHDSVGRLMPLIFTNQRTTFDLIRCILEAETDREQRACQSITMHPRGTNGGGTQ